MPSSRQSKLSGREPEATLLTVPSGFCCPSCASPEFRELSRKQERRLAWLAVMLRKRGWLDDLKLADKIERGFWP